LFGVVVFEYRITKYNPVFRDSSGAYTRNEWTSVSDIGRAFDGVVLTAEEYSRVENAYVTVALSFLRESGQPSLTVTGLENNRRHPFEFSEGSTIGVEKLGNVIRLILREMLWCQLEAVESFLHFGWDYYMYVGISRLCPETEVLAQRLGIFVEEFISPCKREVAD
jgi:hypothetical protein